MLTSEYKGGCGRSLNVELDFYVRSDVGFPDVGDLKGIGSPD